LNFLQQSLEDRASAVLGLRVRCDDVTLSPARQTLDAHDVTIGEGDPPLLFVHRLKAKLSAADTLEPKIVIASLALEAPVLHLTRTPDGVWNFPSLANPREPASPSTHQHRITDDRWAVDCCSLEVTDGEIHLV